MNETAAEPVCVPAESSNLARIEKFAGGPLPWSPKVVSEFLDTLSDEELLGACTEIFAAHDALGLANPVCSTPVCLVLARKPCTDWPQGFNKHDRIVWASLPEEMREIVKRREHERCTELRRQQNRISDELKRLRGGDLATPPWGKEGSENVYSQAK
jgi:hypothetical protein